MLVRYIRDISNRPVACVVAVGPGLVGWSKCHKNDSFSKQRAREIAAGRAANGSDEPIPCGRILVYDNSTGTPVKTNLRDVIEMKLHMMHVLSETSPVFASTVKFLPNE